MADVEASLEAARAEQVGLRDTIATLRGQLESEQREAFAEKQRMFSDVADAQGELAFEADRRAAFEREVVALRTRLQQQQQQQQRKHKPVDEGSSLTQLQAVCARQADDAATALRRAVAAEKELAGARTRVEELTASARDLQGRMDTAEARLREHADETAAAQARAESAERATAAEAERVRTQLQRRLHDAESRAASLGDELEAALKAKREREVQAAQASENVAAGASLKVSCSRAVWWRKGMRRGSVPSASTSFEDARLWDRKKTLECVGFLPRNLFATCVSGTR